MEQRLRTIDLAYSRLYMIKSWVLAKHFCRQELNISFNGLTNHFHFTLEKSNL